MHADQSMAMHGRSNEKQLARADHERMYMQFHTYSIYVRIYVYFAEAQLSSNIYLCIYIARNTVGLLQLLQLQPWIWVHA